MQETGDINPTRGQAIFVLYMLAVNVALASTGHFTLYHYFWSFDGRHGQFITCLANRLGALSIANIPLLFLYSGRNNVMLKLTGKYYCVRKEYFDNICRLVTSYLPSTPSMAGIYYNWRGNPSFRAVPPCCHIRRQTF
jgi:hypothetical protein